MKKLVTIISVLLLFGLFKTKRNQKLSSTKYITKLSIITLLFSSCLMVNVQAQKSTNHKKVNSSTVDKKELWFENTTTDDSETKKITIFFQIIGNKVYGETNYLEFDKGKTWMITPTGSFNGTIQNKKDITVYEQITNQGGAVIKKGTRKFILTNDKSLVEIIKGKKIPYKAVPAP